MRTFLIVGALALTGCSWLFQEHLSSEYSGSSEPMCSTGKGLVTLDGLLAVLNLGGAVLVAAAGNDPSGQDTTPLIVGSVIDGVIFGLSALSGSNWADSCREAREQWDAHGAEQPAQRPDPPSERPVRFGEAPLYCAPESADVGLCFLGREACEQAKPDGCAERDAGACFNATRTIEQTRIMVCAIGVKDCEDRRGKYADNPDYVDVGARCGIYRVRPKNAPPAPTKEP